HTMLVRQALSGMSVLDHPQGQGDAFPEVWAAFKRVNGIRGVGFDDHGNPKVNHLGDKNEQVRAMRFRLERQVVRDGLARVADLGAKKQWGQAGILAHDWLSRAAEILKTPENPPSKELDELREILIKIRDLQRGQE